MERKTKAARAARHTVIKGRGVTIKVDEKAMAALDAAAAKREANRPPNHFATLDAVMQRWTDLKGTAAVAFCVLDADPDESATETMRRHLQTELDAMDAALSVGWAGIIRGEAPPSD